MESLTLQQLFGVNAVQDSQTLTINKSDLKITPNLNNTAESLLIAILLNAFRTFSGYLEDEFGQPITDENNQPIEFDNSDAYQALKIFRWENKPINRNNLIYLRYTIVIESYTVYENQ
jgi:hypothetical protein